MHHADLTPVQFFMAHAGHSYDSQRETLAQGRYRGARRLAAAERKASAAGVSFEWSIDPDCDSSEWQCMARDVDGTVIGSLHAINFGDGGEPWGDPYRRVIEAEIVLDAE